MSTGATDQILIGTGVLTWMHHERISDRYGSVYLNDRATDGAVEMFFPEGKGRLTALVIEPRKSGHIGDIFRGLFPRMPKVGDRLILGEGEAFSEECEGIASVGVDPGDGRHSDWLNPRALYDCHESVVQLIWEPL